MLAKVKNADRQDWYIFPFSSKLDAISPFMDRICVFRWQGTVLYHITLPEFYDSDSNNVGDLQGLQMRITYLQYLGVQGIVLKNFLHSVDPFWDKVKRFKDIDPRAGKNE